MSVSEMRVEITCDACSHTTQEEVPLFDLTGYDIENLNEALIERGWRADGSEHFCPNCPEPAEIPDGAELCPCQDPDNPEDSPCATTADGRCEEDCEHGCKGSGYLDPAVPAPEASIP